MALSRIHLLALALVAGFTLLPAQPARAQTSDTWKSVAIIGGSTAAGAYIGHKVAGPTGAWIGAGVGASAGYAIDRRRRANEYYPPGYADNGYYGQGGPDPSGGYYGGPQDSGPYPPPGPSYPAGYLNRRSRQPQ
ncbi:MAG: hypothetical protein JO041_10090 [Acidobacteria bacterium]|nr:hypothetical protein [Acidobacteriota bacterium]